MSGTTFIQVCVIMALTWLMIGTLLAMYLGARYPKSREK